jgi:ergothioneine biosynthesis protein EgtB
MNDRLSLRSQDPLDHAGAQLASRYRDVRAVTDGLASRLSAEDCAIQSMPDASPVKWHLAHTSWFFETFVLDAHLAGYRAFDPAFRVLFNSYYNSVGEKHPRPERGLLSRPSLDRVLAYRQHVDHAMEKLLERGSLPREASALVELGLNHEQQHQELVLTDVKHLLSCNPLKPAYAEAREDRAGPDAAPLTWSRFAEGLIRVGHDGAGFAFDNESPRHRQYLRSYALANRLVTNGEYRAFMDDGGYARPELWLSEGWDWIAAGRIAAPGYWERADSSWRQFSLRGMRAIDAGAPVCHVSLYEADAYARWAGARLPTEAEWEFAAATHAIDGNLLESGSFEPRAGARGAPMAQLFGDVWEWTQSAYAPYPGYRPASGAIGEYNGKFMCNQYVLRGGSCVTPESHVRATYRNFFPASARWQFSGIRLARDAA